ncbi:uncharacterized protein LOC110465501 [Mizuhopecten yessoensis]|uniref:Uncharacterized protein n=1 Tax=Mizuhopecten yessoensis TaxID=6573 RepID=A0A210PRK1_MIZYE|nr:uncharacterized protein LOC110465501 [Mizuhopecten yessoensis]OWF39072.1 hypothetical protein KP79_PYT03927 [Mizuhopecten yessoensis]
MSQTSELLSEGECHGECQCTCSQTTMSEKYTDESSELSRQDTALVLEGNEEWSETSEMECLSEQAWSAQGAILVDQGPHAHAQCDHLHWEGVSMTEDDIEIITDGSYDNYHQDVYYIDPVVAQTLFSDILLHRQHAANVHIHVEGKTKRQKFIARAVMIVSSVMFTVSVLLVMISLIMSDHIDDLVRDANNLRGPSEAPGTMTTVAANFTTNTTLIGNRSGVLS